MMELEFLDGEPPVPADAPAPEAIVEAPQAEPQEPAQGGPPRGPDGKFMSAQKEPEPQAQPAPEPAPVVEPPKPEPAEGRLMAMLEEREKRQAAEQRALQAEAQLRQYQQAQLQQPVPDPYEDFQGYMSHQQQEMQRQVIVTKLEMSQSVAAEKYGQETVKAADQWAEQMEMAMPGFKAGMVSQPHPYGALVQAYQRHTAMDRLGDPTRVDAFLAWEAAQKAAQQAPQPAAPAAPTPTPSTPPRSLAGLPSAGAAKPGDSPVGPGVAFDGLFTR